MRDGFMVGPPLVPKNSILRPRNLLPNTSMSRSTTRFMPTTAPGRLSSQTRVYWPFSSVAPEARGPVAASGMYWTMILGSGLCLSVTLPFTSANSGRLEQPTTAKTASRASNDEMRQAPVCTRELSFGTGELDGKPPRAALLRAPREGDGQPPRGDQKFGMT